MLNLVFLLFFSSTLALFETDRAIAAYKNDNLNGAQQLYDHLLIKDPLHYEALYNSGKLAYKQQNFPQAAAYFEKAAQIENTPVGLKEQTFFDLGNSYAQLKEWQKALTAYESVLTINPDNEYAKKTIERIKQIIEEEERKKEQEQEKKDNSNNDQDKQKDQKENQESNQNQQSGETRQEKKQSEQQENKKEEKQEQKKDNKQNNNQKDQENSDQQEQAQQKKDQQNQSGYQKNDGIKQEQQAMSAKVDENQEKKDSEKADYETMLLQAVEQADARMSKLLLQQQLNNEALPNGQKNW